MAKQNKLMILKGHVNEMQLRNSWKRSVVQKILHFFIGWKFKIRGSITFQPIALQ